MCRYSDRNKSTKRQATPNSAACHNPYSRLVSVCRTIRKQIIALLAISTPITMAHTTGRQKPTCSVHCLIPSLSSSPNPGRYNIINSIKNNGNPMQNTRLGFKV